MIVVGARCAGSPLATVLARAGLRVCLVDRATFPSDSPSTHGIWPAGVQLLDRLGVRDELERLTTPIVRGNVGFDDTRFELDGLVERIGAPMLNIRRITLDAILLEAAAATGAEVRTGTTVTGLIEEHGRVAGVRTTAGELRAPLVVGADGARSTVARLVGARDYHVTPPGRLILWAYFEGASVDDDLAWLGKIGDHGYLCSPTDQGLFMASVGVPFERRHEVRRNRDAAFADGLRAWPELDACLAGATRVGPVRMMSRLNGFFRESAGPGWALVGDAGHFKHPAPGQGISDALRQVVQLAPAVEAALDGGGDRALGDWWKWRDADAWEMYWFAHDMGASGPTPLVMREVQRQMAHDPRLAEGLVRVLDHAVPPSEVFTLPLVARAATRAFARNRGRRTVVLRELYGRGREEVRRTRARA